jgi:aspartate-semialdehyde dehydrogenase
LHVRTEKNLEIEMLRNAFKHQDGITLMEAVIPASLPTPATDAQGSQDVFVGRIRVDGDACRLWLVFDPITLEAAQMAACVENWIDKPVTSMLT